VTEKNLDDADVDAALQKVSGELMPQNMHADPLVEPGRGRRRTAGRIQYGRLNRLGRRSAGKLRQAKTQITPYPLGSPHAAVAAYLCTGTMIMNSLPDKPF
jgi:hypothetical protein